MRYKLNYDNLPHELDLSILQKDINISMYVPFCRSIHVLIVHLRSNRDNAHMKHDLLSMDELPRPGTMVSIDAEFVSMQQVRMSTVIAIILANDKMIGGI